MGCGREQMLYDPRDGPGKGGVRPGLIPNPARPPTPYWKERAAISGRVWNPLQRVGSTEGRRLEERPRVNLPVTRRRKWEPEDSRTRFTLSE